MEHPGAGINGRALIARVPDTANLLNAMRAMPHHRPRAITIRYKSVPAND